MLTSGSSASNEKLVFNGGLVSAYPGESDSLSALLSVGGEVPPASAGGESSPVGGEVPPASAGGESSLGALYREFFEPTENECTV